MSPPLPLVSVCVPSHNYAAFLRPCIDSVLAQTLSDFELVVVDDASTDDSVDLIRSEHDRRLRFFRNPVNVGAIATWNRCLELAQGEHVSFLCADDFFLPDKLLKQAEYLDREPTVGLVHADGYWVAENGSRQSSFAAGFPEELQCYLATDHVTAAPLEMRRLASGYNYIHLSSAMFRRHLALDLGGFLARFPYAADWDLWLRLAEHRDLGYIAEPLSALRQHSRNLTWQMRESGQEFRDWYGVAEATFRRWPAGAGECASVRREALRVIGEHLLRRVHANYARGQIAAVRRDLWLGFRHDRRLLLNSPTLATFVKSLVGARRLKRLIEQRPEQDCADGVGESGPASE